MAVARQNTACLLVLLLATWLSSTSGERCPESKKPSLDILCYYEGTKPLDELNICNCTHLVFTEIASVENFTLTFRQDAKLTEKAALELKKLNLILSVSLETEKTSALLKSEEKRITLLNSISEAVRTSEFSGLELDFQFTSDDGIRKENLTSFVRDLRTQLDHHRVKRDGYSVFEELRDDVTTDRYTTEKSVSKSSSTKKAIRGRKKSRIPRDDKNVDFYDEDDELSVVDEYLEEEPLLKRTKRRRQRVDEDGEVIDDENDDDRREYLIYLRLSTVPEIIGKKFDLKLLSKYVDFMTVPTHYITDESEDHVTFHPSRLMGLSDMLNTDSILDLLTGLGAVKSKLIIFVPGFVMEHTLKNAKENTARSPTDGKPRIISQDQMCHLLKIGNWTVERDEDLTAPYAFSKNTWLAFEDETSINIKGKYVLLRELAGAGIFPIDADTESLSCNNRKAGTFANVLYKNFETLARKPRQVVLESLQEEIHDTSFFSQEAGVHLSDYRIVRVVDHSGAVHVIRKNTKTQFECSRQGYFSHPLGCNKFYRCVKFNQYTEDFTVFEYDCPDGLAFDERWEVCVWPGSLPHGAPCTGSSEIAPVPRSYYQCPNVEGYYADPENCRWFFACLDHARDGVTPLTAYEFRCPFGLIFDEDKLACDWPWLVRSGCGTRGAAGVVFTRTGGAFSHEASATFVGGSAGVLDAGYINAGLQDGGNPVNHLVGSQIRSGYPAPSSILVEDGGASHRGSGAQFVSHTPSSILVEDGGASHRGSGAQFVSHTPSSILVEDGGASHRGSGAQFISQTPSSILVEDGGANHRGSGAQFVSHTPSSILVEDGGASHRGSGAKFVSHTPSSILGGDGGASHRESGAQFVSHTPSSILVEDGGASHRGSGAQFVSNAPSTILIEDGGASHRGSGAQFVSSTPSSILVEDGGASHRGNVQSVFSNTPSTLLVHDAGARHHGNYVQSVSSVTPSSVLVENGGYNHGSNIVQAVSVNTPRPIVQNIHTVHATSPEVDQYSPVFGQKVGYKYEKPAVAFELPSKVYAPQAVPINSVKISVPTSAINVTPKPLIELQAPEVVSTYAQAAPVLKHEIVQYRPAISLKPAFYQTEVYTPRPVVVQQHFVKPRPVVIQQEVITPRPIIYKQELSPVVATPKPVVYQQQVVQTGYSYEKPKVKFDLPKPVVYQQLQPIVTPKPVVYQQEIVQPVVSPKPVVYQQQFVQPVVTPKPVVYQQEIVQQVVTPKPVVYQQEIVQVATPKPVVYQQQLVQQVVTPKPVVYQQKIVQPKPIVYQEVVQPKPVTYHQVVTPKPVVYQEQIAVKTPQPVVVQQSFVTPKPAVYQQQTVTYEQPKGYVYEQPEVKLSLPKPVVYEQQQIVSPKPAVYQQQYVTPKPVVYQQQYVTPKPVVYQQEIVTPKPVVYQQEIIAPKPVVYQQQQFVTPKQVVYQQQYVTPKPVVYQQEIVTPKPVVYQQEIVTPKPVVYQQQYVTPKPVVYQQEIVTPKPVVYQQEIIAPKPVVYKQQQYVTPKPVVYQQEIVTPKPVVYQQQFVTPKPVVYQQEIVTPKPVVYKQQQYVTPKPVIYQQEIITPKPVVYQQQFVSQTPVYKEEIIQPKQVVYQEDYVKVKPQVYQQTQKPVVYQQAEGYVYNQPEIQKIEYQQVTQRPVTYFRKELKRPTVYIEPTTPKTAVIEQVFNVQPVQTYQTPKPAPKVFYKQEINPVVYQNSYEVTTAKQQSYVVPQETYEEVTTPQAIIYQRPLYSRRKNIARIQTTPKPTFIETVTPQVRINERPIVVNDIPLISLEGKTQTTPKTVYSEVFERVNPGEQRVYRPIEVVSTEIPRTRVYAGQDYLPPVTQENIELQKIDLSTAAPVLRVTDSKIEIPPPPEGYLVEIPSTTVRYVPKTRVRVRPVTTTTEASREYLPPVPESRRRGKARAKTGKTTIVSIGQVDKDELNDENLEGVLNKYGGKNGDLSEEDKEKFVTKVIKGNGRGTISIGKEPEVSTVGYEITSSRTRSRGRSRTFSSTSTTTTEAYEEESTQGDTDNADISLATLDLKNLKVKKDKKTVIVVSQVSDANPILIGKLAGQCSCQSNKVELKKSRRPSGRRGGSRNEDDEENDGTSPADNDEGRRENNHRRPQNSRSRPDDSDNGEYDEPSNEGRRENNHRRPQNSRSRPDDSDNGEYDEPSNEGRRENNHRRPQNSRPDDSDNGEYDNSRPENGRSNNGDGDDESLSRRPKNRRPSNNERRPGGRNGKARGFQTTEETPILIGGHPNNEESVYLDNIATDDGPNGQVNVQILDENGGVIGTSSTTIIPEVSPSILLPLAPSRRTESLPERTTGRRIPSRSKVRVPFVKEESPLFTPISADVIAEENAKARNDVEGEKSKVRAGAAFDRYGPGGWRSADETLQGSVDCKRPGLFRHPKYCNKFYSCNYDPWKKRYTLAVFNCPVHLAYDSNIGACNWPSKGPACADDNLLV